MAVYGYVRVSTARQAAEGDSLDVQRRMIEGYALMHALPVDDILIEGGVSGSVPLSERPAGAALLARLQSGDVVIAAKLDRCFRSALDALTVVEQLKSRGVRLHLIDLGGDIAGNGLSRLFLTIAAAFAEAERDRIRERITSVKTDQRARGRYLGGKIPFGYRIGTDGNLIEHELEQKAIEEMAKMKEEGMPLRKVAAVMKEKGFRVSHETVRNYHSWSPDDDTVAYYIWKYGDKLLPMNKDKIAERLGMKPGSITMRGQNFHHVVYGSGGLSHPAQQSYRVYEKIKNLSEPELRAMVIQIITKD